MSNQLQETMPRDTCKQCGKALVPGQCECPKAGIQACRPQDRAMLATPEGAALVAGVVKMLEDEGATERERFGKWAATHWSWVDDQIKRGAEEGWMARAAIEREEREKKA